MACAVWKMWPFAGLGIERCVRDTGELLQRKFTSSLPVLNSGRSGKWQPVMRRAWPILAVVALALCTPLPAAAQAITVQEQTKPKGLWDPLLGMFVHTAATADVNGDGWPDLFVGGFYKDLPWNRFFRLGTRGATQISPDRLMLGGPKGFTVDQSFPEMREGNASGSAFADLDGDGDLDLLVSHYYPYHLTDADPQAKAQQAGVIVLRNDGGHFIRAGQVASGIAARALAVADFAGTNRRVFGGI